METEAPEDYCASNGQCSPKKENCRILVDLSTSLPNGQTTPQGPKSPVELRIKQEEETGEESEMRCSALEEMDQSQGDESGLEDPMTDSPSNLQDVVSGADGTSDTGGRLPNGDRPFQCNQCGVSFTQKGNLLRHIKLHTGEKPFKCPFCSYACRRRDALTGHLRTHAVGKPHKCNYCGRSYKQRTSLEEHKERCHSFLQSVDPLANPGPYSGEVAKESRAMAEPSVMASFDRPPIIERLQSTVGKRKSTNPQKFVGEKVMRYSYPELGYDMGMKYEKEAEMMQVHMMDQAISYLGSDSLRPMVHHPGPPLSMADVVPMVNPLFHHHFPSLAHRMERPGGRELPLPQPTLVPPPGFPGQPASNGPVPLARNSLGVQQQHQHQHQHQQPQVAQEDSPNNSGLDSVDSARSSPQEKAGHHGSHPTPRPRSGGDPAPRARCWENSPAEAPHGAGASGGTAEAIRGPAERPLSREGVRRDGVRVFGRSGREVRAFQCEHCRVLFLDHVMYTIHMGCHGYRDPLECNICGHRSQDRYEFSSHIVRGEHTLQ